MDLQSFSIDELFKEKSISASLLNIEKPTALSMKPQDLYERIKAIAKWRYQYEMPE
jgi:hypothetical protein